MGVKQRGDACTTHLEHEDTTVRLGAGLVPPASLQEQLAHFSVERLRGRIVARSRARLGSFVKSLPRKSLGHEFSTHLDETQGKGCLRACQSVRARSRNRGEAENATHIQR